MNVNVSRMLHSCPSCQPRPQTWREQAAWDGSSSPAGAGAIATRVRPLLRRVGHELVLVDLVDPADADAGETVVVADITDEKAMTSAFEGSDCVVHLGGFPKERPWEDIARVNIDGTQVVLNACKAAGVRRVLIASSLHAVGALTAQEVSVTAEPVAAPDSYYGVGKVASEALAKLYGTRFDMAVVAARLGTAEPIPGSPRTLSTWLSTGDMARLIEATAALRSAGVPPGLGNVRQYPRLGRPPGRPTHRLSPCR